jgi:L-fucose mutarotase
MLRGISPLLGPDLLSLLYRMGHGDELVLADAHFPGESCGQRIARADGHRIADLLDGLLPLISLDKHGSSAVAMMAPVPGDQADPAIKASYQQIITRHHPWHTTIDAIERQTFYQRATQAFAVVMTGDTKRYSNLIIRRGNDDV